MADRSPVRRYYADYVNHMIRFFITCPEGLSVAGRSQVDVTNWLAVQSVWCSLSDDDKSLLTDLYSQRGDAFGAIVTAYLTDHPDCTARNIWGRIAKISASIARARGLL